MIGRIPAPPEQISAPAPRDPVEAVVAAVDIGGTKLAGGLIDTQGRLLHRVVLPTPRGADGEEPVWPQLSRLLDALIGAAGSTSILGVGIGSAGPIDVDAGTVSPVNIPSWRRFPLVTRIADYTGLPVRLTGDGICAAAGEHWLGAARGHDDALVMVVSTGVGGGIIRSGQLCPGRSGNAGYVGHMVIAFDGEPCPCGGRGCVEAYASGPSMVAWARRHGWGKDGATAADLAADARKGDPIAREAFTRCGRALAACIVSVAAADDLGYAVLGGGVSQAADLLLPAVRDAIGQYAKSESLAGIEVTTAALGGDAGLYGAAALILDPTRYPARL